MAQTAQVAQKDRNQPWDPIKSCVLETRSNRIVQKKEPEVKCTAKGTNAVKSARQSNSVIAYAVSHHGFQSIGVRH
jgi:hypothetical protein